MKDDGGGGDPVDEFEENVPSLSQGNVTLCDDLPAYLAPILADFTSLASQAGYGHLAYLLEIARLEVDALQEDGSLTEH
jgi:hypothetical protein